MIKGLRLWFQRQKLSYKDTFIVFMKTFVFKKNPFSIFRLTVMRACVNEWIKILFEIIFEKKRRKKKKKPQKRN